MIQSITTLLVKAIKEKRRIAIRYRKQQDIRVFEPHAIYTDKQGDVVVDGYQIRGPSKAGRSAPFWRPYRVKNVSAISILKEVFEARTKEGFTPNKPRYSSGLLAIVEQNKPAFVHSAPTLQQAGPFLPRQAPGVH